MRLRLGDLVEFCPPRLLLVCVSNRINFRIAEGGLGDLGELGGELLCCSTVVLGFSTCSVKLVTYPR